MAPEGLATTAAAERVGPPWLRALVDLRRGEVAALAWSALYIFAVLSAYYVIRPVRDEMGAHSGVENLPWLFSATLVAMLAVTPLFGGLVKRLPRKRFITWTYSFFALNLVVFIGLLNLSSEAQGVWVGRAFFVWASVFNLFVVSVFWALMVDVFDAEQGKRLFGFLAAGASVGAIAGSSVVVTAASVVPPVLLLIASVVLLEVAVFAVGRLSAISERLLRAPGEGSEEVPIGGSIVAGLTRLMQSPYLLAIAAHMALFAITSTFLYFQQAEIARGAFGADRAARTQFFGRIDLWVNTLTLLVQLFLTSRILKHFGVAVTLAALPVFSILGFGALALWPTVGVLVALQVGRRVGNFALTRPTRELLFTVLSREDKYKAKSVIDTVVYRLGDQVGSWSYAFLGGGLSIGFWAGAPAIAGLGLGMAGVSWVAVPLSALWLANSLWLGRRQERRARESAAHENVAHEAPARRAAAAR